MKRHRGNDSGAALLVVLLFMAIVAILITTMLAVAGNETLISGLHRDGVRAKEVAEGGLAEGLQRLGLGHYFALTSGVDCYDADVAGDVFFRNSLDPTSAVADFTRGVRICLLQPGEAGAIWEIQSNFTVGVARRRLSLIAMQQVTNLLPDIVYGHDCSQGGNAKILTGDIYCQTFVDHKTIESAQRLTYGGWYVMKDPKSGEKVDPCYTQQSCAAAGFPNWWAGHRRALFRDRQIDDQVPGSVDTRRLRDVLTYACPEAGADQTLEDADPSHILAGDTVSDLPPGAAWQSGDKKQDNTAMPSDEKLYWCAQDGRPYTWVRETFPDPELGSNVTVWFKTIEYEDWLNDYWVFCRAVGDPVAECTSDKVMSYIKSQTLVSQPYRGAVPPFPDFDTLDNNFTDRIVGGGPGTLTVLNSSDVSAINWGCKVPEMNPCPGGVSDPRVILLTNGDFKINSNLDIHGTILVGPNSSLFLNGNIRVWGVVIVDGTLELGTGKVEIYGGLVAKNTAELTGTIEVYAGGSVSSVPVGGGPVDSISWWQR